MLNDKRLMWAILLGLIFLMALGIIGSVVVPLPFGFIGIGLFLVSGIAFFKIWAQVKDRL